MAEETTGAADAPVPASKAELLARIQREWQALQTTIAAASEAALLRPGLEAWSPKDHLAHLAAWLDILLKHYLGSQTIGEATGVDISTLQSPYTTDDLNAIFFKRYTDLSLAQVRLWLEQSHIAALARLRGMSFSGLMRVFDPQDPEARLLIQEVMANTNEHYQEHNRIIRALLERP